MRISLWQQLYCALLLHGQVKGLFENLLPVVQENLQNTMHDLLEGIEDNRLSWTPPTLPDRKDLECKCHDNGFDDRDHCCTCKATPVWEGTEIDLHIEYVSVLTKSLIISDHSISNTTKVYQIIHKGGVMGLFPSNLCNWDKDKDFREICDSNLVVPGSVWDRLVKLDFSYNNIKFVPNITCLKNLDLLNLAYNKIQFLSNTSLTGLTHLRYLNLKDNKIMSMDSGITSPTLHLSFLDLSGNFLTSLDVTNGISQYPFCRYNFSDNQLNEFTNELDFKLDTTKIYGPGFVSFTNNDFSTFPDFSKVLGIDDIRMLGQLVHFGFDFRNINLNCDCVIEPLLELAIGFVESLWNDYMNITCHTPENVRDIPLKDVSLDDLICYLERDEGCPPSCTCIDQPSKQTVFVDCSNRGLTSMPEEMPQPDHSPNIHLSLDGNFITELTNESYLDSVSMLNMSNNQLVEISDAAIESLSNSSLDFSFNNQLQMLPQGLQSKNMCNVTLEGLILFCDCESKWLPSWFSVKGCEKSPKVQCQVPDYGLMAAEEFSRNHLKDCIDEGILGLILSTSIGSATVLLAVVGLSSLFFKYEMVILALRLRQKLCRSPRVHPMFRFDVYLSFDHTDDKLRLWVGLKLLKFLEKVGYKVFYPPRDLMFGSDLSTETIDALQCSRNFVLILSENYVEQEDRNWVDEEWRYGWKRFIRDPARNIVLINYDHISSFQIDHPQIRAFVRVGGQVEFDNHDGNIMVAIETKLGQPFVQNILMKEKHYSDLNNLWFGPRSPLSNSKTTFKTHGKIKKYMIDPFTVETKEYIVNAKPSLNWPNK